MGQLASQGFVHVPENGELFECKTIKDMRRKDGSNEIPAGTPVVLLQHKKRENRVFVMDPATGRYMTIYWQNAHNYLDAIEPAPDMEELQSEMNDGVCTTPSGEQCEADGQDEYGFFPWTLIKMGF